MDIQEDECTRHLDRDICQQKRDSHQENREARQDLRESDFAAQNANIISFKLMWTFLAITIAVAIGGGSILVAQVRQDIESGHERAAKIAVIESCVADFKIRMIRFEDKLDLIVSALQKKK
jgi:hypothetical protein